VVIISYKIIRQFSESYPDSEDALNNWYTVTEKADWANFNELREMFGSADYVSNGLYVFNMKEGVINLSKSDKKDRPCPTFALQDRTDDGQYIRVIFAECNGITKVVTCYNLEKDFVCNCPDDKPSQPKQN
jgi:hypothetical protein